MQDDKKYLNDLGVFYLWLKILREDEGVRKGIQLNIIDDELVLTTRNGQEVNSKINISQITEDKYIEDIYITTPLKENQDIEYNGKIYHKDVELEQNMKFLTFKWNNALANKKIFILIDEISSSNLVIDEKGSSSKPIYINDNALTKEILSLDVGNGEISGGEIKAKIKFIGDLNGIADLVANDLAISNTPSMGGVAGNTSEYNYNGSLMIELDFSSFTNKEIDDLINNIDIE